MDTIQIMQRANRKRRRQPRGPISDFGHLVKLKLVILGKTQDWLARKIGAYPQTVSQHLRSEYPQRETIKKYAEALGCRPSELDHISLPENDFGGN